MDDQKKKPDKVPSEDLRVGQMRRVLSPLYWEWLSRRERRHD